MFFFSIIFNKKSLSIINCTTIRIIVNNEFIIQATYIDEFNNTTSIYKIKIGYNGLSLIFPDDMALIVYGIYCIIPDY